MKKAVLMLFALMLAFVGFGQEVEPVANSFDWSGLWTQLKEIGLWSMISVTAITVINYLMGIIPTTNKWSFLLKTLGKLFIAWLEKMPDRRKVKK